MYITRTRGNPEKKFKKMPKTMDDGKSLKNLILLCTYSVCTYSHIDSITQGNNLKRMRMILEKWKSYAYATSQQIKKNQMMRDTLTTAYESREYSIVENA